MLVVFVPISFLKAPEERHIVSLLRSCMFFCSPFCNQHFAPMELKPVDGVNLAPMGLRPSVWGKALLFRDALNISCGYAARREA